MNKNKNVNIQEYELPVSIQEEEGGFIATCPVWKDCYAQADTLEEALNEISYVAPSLLELYKEEGKKIPLKLKNTTQNGGSTFNVNVPVIVSSV